MDEPTLTEENRLALNRLRDRLAWLPDQRLAGSIKHSLADVIGCALCAMVAGFEDFSAMALFTRHRLGWLRQFLPLENGAPSHDTFRYVFMGLAPEALVAVLAEWSSGLAGRQVSIDGKASRGTYDRQSGQCALHLLRAWVDAASLSVGQVACECKSNEIEAIPRLLDSLRLEGALVTIDAMGCQTQVARRIDQAGGRYILALKGNQGQAHAVVKKHFTQLNIPAAARTEEHSHGRYEKRECWVQSDLSFFGKSWKWQGLTCVARIRRETCRPGGSGADGREATVEDHYYLCSTQPDAKAILAAVRAHWGIENRCHWALDVVFGEDDSPLRDLTAARNLSTLRDMALHLLRSHPKKASVAKKRQEASLDSNFRAEVFSIFHA